MRGRGKGRGKGEGGEKGNLESSLLFIIIKESENKAGGEDLYRGAGLKGGKCGHKYRGREVWSSGGRCGHWDEHKRVPH